MVGGGLGTFLLGMKHLSEGLQAVSGSGLRKFMSRDLHDLVRTSRQGQLNRIGPDDPNSPIRVLVELDILNAYERVRAYYLNIAETLAGGKGN